MQKRTLKYAILGMLSLESLSGYDLYLKFNVALGEFWTAKHSQIYPELKKLTEEGLVSYNIEISGSALEKKVYSITPAGMADFIEWLNRLEPMQPTAKDVFRLRLFFAAELEPNKRIKLIQKELKGHEARLAYLKRKLDDFGDVTDKNSPAFYDKLVLTGAVMRERTHCEWLKKCIEMCEN